MGHGAVALLRLLWLPIRRKDGSVSGSFTLVKGSGEVWGSVWLFWRRTTKRREPWVGPFGSSGELWPATDKDDVGFCIKGSGGTFFMALMETERNRGLCPKGLSTESCFLDYARKKENMLNEFY